MKYLVTSQEMKRYDSNTIERIGIPGMVLMERAALAAFEQIQQYFGQNENARKTVLILVGTGNNGGDGLALARLLAQDGYEVCVECAGDEAKASQQWKSQLDILKNSLCETVAGITGRNVQDKEYTVWVDALFGIGLTREITGKYAEAVERFNAGRGLKVALDIPSGLDADSGKIWGCAVRADVTVTFGFCKRGLVLYPGCEYAGKVITAPIGIAEQSFFGELPGMFCLDEPLNRVLPLRKPEGNKGTFGKVLLIAGSINMAGAAILAAKAAYRAGAGMVKVITPAENRIILQETVPEALLGTEENLEESLQWADVAAVGPGMGMDEKALACLKKVIWDSKIPLLIDADGLNLLAEEWELQAMLAAQERELILTPHMGEFARLTGKTVAELKERPDFYGRELAARLGAVVAVKDARTFVCAQHKAVCVNIVGNSGMATAGSGDVLAGIAAGLLAQGMSAYEAACVGVYVHALAGDRAAKENGEHGLMAGDILNGIGKP